MYRLRVFLGAVVVASLVCVPTLDASGQAVPLLARGVPLAGRAIRIATTFLAQYAGGKALDQVLAELGGEGEAIAAELAELEARFEEEASRDAEDRVMLLRQLALTAELRETVEGLMTGPPESDDEALIIERRLDLAFAEVERVQEEHGRRIGRVEESLDSLWAFFESLPEISANAPQVGVGGRRPSDVLPLPPSVGTDPAPAVAYENDFLRVQVDAASISPDGRYASLTLSWENPTPESQYLAGMYGDLSLADNHATRWRWDPNGSAGLPMQVCNSPCDRVISHEHDPTEGLSFSRG